MALVSVLALESGSALVLVLVLVLVLLLVLLCWCNWSCHRNCRLDVDSSIR